MKKKRNFSDEELMQAMGLDLPSSKSGTEAHGETVPETMALIFDEPESMKQPEPTHPEGTPGGRVTAFRPMPVTAVFIGNHQSYQSMMAKIVKGAGTKGIVDYILDREKETSLIDHDGVLVSDNGSIARSFIAQSRLNPKLEKFIGHISLSVSRRDLPRLIDELVVYREYMMKMGIRDTQYIIGRHHDKEHPHVHIAFNHIDNNGRTISDRNNRYRSERVCKELTRKYGLYFAEGKEQVNTHCLKEPDRTKYELYFLLKAEVGMYGDWDTLIANLRKQGMKVRFKYKGRTDEIQGVVFSKNGYSFNDSKIDRQFGYSKITAALNWNGLEERQAQSYQQCISLVSSGGEEFISGSLRLLDLTPSSCAETPEEAKFHRLMQQKNKGF